MCHKAVCVCVWLSNLGVHGSLRFPRGAELVYVARKATQCETNIHEEFYSKNYLKNKLML